MNDITTVSFVPAKHKSDLKIGSLIRYNPSDHKDMLCLYESLEDYDFHATDHYAELGTVFMIIDFSKNLPAKFLSEDGYEELPAKILSEDGYVGYADVHYSNFEIMVKNK